MLYDFNYYNPTKIYFGKDSLSNLHSELVNYGNNVLLVYGKNAIKKMGLYDEVITILKASNKNIVELSGIKSNPTYEQMMKGAQLVREHHIDLILAVGGGSVIDCSKGISVSAYCESDPWQKYWLDFADIDNKVVPVASILTMVGTGSEMNGGSVITHEETKIKSGRVFPAQVNPKFSILNPEYTYSVPQYQMLSGIFDIMSHLMEQYFSGEDDNTTDYIIEGLLEALITNVKVAIKDNKNYEARSNIMWCATMALNTISGVGKTQDWEVHMIEHQLGAYTDCAHGMGLAAISVAYYKYIYQYGIHKFIRYAKRIWNVDPVGKSDDEIALAGIAGLASFIKECGMATTLKELKATKEMLPLIAESCVLGGAYKQMNEEDILAVLNNCYE